MAFQLSAPFKTNLTTDYGPLGQLAANVGQQFTTGLDAGRKQQSLAGIGQDIQAGNYAGAAQKALAAGDATLGVSLLGLSQKNGDREFDRKLFGGATAAASPSAQPAASLSALGQPNDIENQFVGTVKQAGLTNPIGLGAVAAYGKAESGYNPQNVNRVWNDPSQSGQPGQAGGIMSWREDRLRALNAYAQQQGEQPGAISPKTQAMFLVQEDPTLLPKLQAAKTPDEANQIMANAWRFAGYDKPGGENARRLALTQQYAQRYGQQPQAAAPGVAQPQGVQVAENEADVQRLEALQAAQGRQQSRPVASIPGDDPIKLRQEAQAYAQTNPEAARQLNARADAAEGRGVQVAQAAPPPGSPVADIPAQGAQPAQFVIPGATPQQSQSIASDPNVQKWSAIAAQARTEQGRAYAKSQFDLAVADAKGRMEGAQETVEGKRLANEKLRREINGEGARPMTPQERQAYSVPDGQPAYMNGKGEPKFGPASTKITNSIGATEGEYAKANGKAISSRFEKIVEEGDAASQEVGVLSQLRALGGQIKNMGSGAALQAKLAEFGIKVGENVSEIEAYGALIDKLTPQQKVAGAGATSDFDARMFKNSLPGLMRTPGGNEIIISTLEALNTYKRQRADVVAEAMASNEKPADVIKKLKELPDPFAAFKDARKASIQGSGTPGAEAPGGVKPPPPQQFKEGARASNGQQTIIFRNGQWVPE